MLSYGNTYRLAVLTTYVVYESQLSCKDNLTSMLHVEAIHMYVNVTTIIQPCNILVDNTLQICNKLYNHMPQPRNLYVGT